MNLDDDDELIIPSTQPQQQPTPPQTIGRSQRHEAFKAKLLGRNFGRRRSLDLDNAEDQQLQGGGGDEDDGEEGGGRGDEEDEDHEGSGSGAKAKMKSLKEKLTAKGKVKEVANAKGGKKKLEAVGPSGLSWTPMEKQVSRSRVF